MYFSLTNIKTLNDEHYQISCLLLNEKDINVNRGNSVHTMLSRLCEEKHRSIHGVELLLRHKNIDVNKGLRPPLGFACQNIEKEGDYFHQVTTLLLQHPKINVNLAFDHYSSFLSALCMEGCRSALGVKMLLQRDDIDVNKAELAFTAAARGHPDLCKAVIEHSKYQLGLENILFEFLQNSSFENTHFKLSKVTLETIGVLLQKGADPNKPKGLLAYAVNFLPYDVCKLLLEHGACPDSSFHKGDILNRVLVVAP